jgi:N-acetylglucosamine-6-phosphate deacetylase
MSRCADMNEFLLAHGQFYTGEEILTGKAILVKEGRIAAIGAEADFPTEIERIDLQGLKVAPGFIDVQINGGGGCFFAQHPNADSLTAMYEANLRFGTTHFLPTLVSSPYEKMMEAIQGVGKALQARQPGVLGLHLEGPYFHIEKFGAHKREFIRSPTTEELLGIIEKGKEVVKILTLAPELCTDEQLKLLRESGIIISAGHSNATYEQAKHFFERGVTKVTHLYNAMSGFGHREPGLVGAAFDLARWTSIIVDGFHCHYSTVRIAKQQLKDKLILITDAVDNPESQMDVNERAAQYGDFVARYHYENGRFVTDDGKLAGSSLTMLDAVRNCVQHVGIPLDESLRMASTYPAALLGLDKELGYIKAGFQAALTIFDDSFQVKAVVAEGKYKLIGPPMRC